MDLKQNCEHSARIADKLSQNCEQTELFTNGRFCFFVEISDFCENLHFPNAVFSRTTENLLLSFTSLLHSLFLCPSCVILFIILPSFLSILLYFASLVWSLAYFSFFAFVS